MRLLPAGLLLAALCCAGARAQPAPFDQSHGAWDALLHKYVVVVDGGRASRVRYAALAQDRAALTAYTDALSRVRQADFQDWSKAQRLAFLVNAYNAFAVQKVLSRYPDLRSIWDFGRIFGNPFKDRFFTLFGRPASLDDIEKDMLRAPGAYDDVRIHVALNCASIGCPMLREEAYAAPRLDAQLEDQMRRFLADRSRNRYSPQSGRLELSKIFDWYQDDWQRGSRNFDGAAPPARSVAAYLARYATLLADQPAGQARIAAQQAAFDYLEYDWRLNDAAATP